MHKVNDRESGYRPIGLFKRSENGMKINCMGLVCLESMVPGIGRSTNMATWKVM